ncbi:HD domain-containing phosphohydrolase [Tabrizicola sp.]|uniref:HD domain-containing phosphohydrolase n=1 Tax=Tabrizicola sp. TaxID=2005166 RepID=UPI003D2B00A8
MTDDLLVFAEDIEAQSARVVRPWKVLIADDDDEVHVMTKLALADYHYLGQPISFLDSYSLAETISTLRENNDIALVLLDVVMDKPNAGLEIVKFLRETLNEHDTRIVLRTGEPGEAPERLVILQYDINDYKEKTELTATKLYTVVHTSIKSFCDIRTIRASRAGLNRIISEAASLYKNSSDRAFLRSAVEQLSNLMCSNPDVALLRRDGLNDTAAFHLSASGGFIRSIAGTGRFSLAEDLHAMDLLESDEMQLVHTAVLHKRAIKENGKLACTFTSERLGTFVLFFDGIDFLQSFDQAIIDIFLSHVCRAMENSTLQREIMETQREIIVKLGEVVEFRSRETSDHVHRVSQICGKIARALGYSDEAIEELELAAALHDLGKIGITDTILNKAGKLSDDEFKIMCEHTIIGQNILKNSSRRVFQLASVIAAEHHEKWDGSGYPLGKKGVEIDTAARIVAIADVYDALRSERAYKSAWTRQATCDHLKAEAGRHFDPLLLDQFFKVEPEINPLY